MYGIPGMMMETVFRTQPGQCRTSICKKKIYIYINNIIICMDNNVILLNYICMYITLCTFRYMSTFIMIGKSFFLPVMLTRQCCWCAPWGGGAAWCFLFPIWDSWQWAVAPRILLHNIKKEKHVWESGKLIKTTTSSFNELLNFLLIMAPRYRLQFQIHLWQCGTWAKNQPFEDDEEDHH